MIYLDYAATSPVRLEVAEVTERVMRESFGNASALYDLGMVGEKIIKKARSIIAESLGVKDKTIYFTSCGSESNNTVIRGIGETMLKQGKHIICSAVEHPSVLRAMEYLEREKGYALTKIGVDNKGNLDMEGLESALRPDTVLCCVMQVNNEIGNIFPLTEIGKLVHKANPRCVFHVDGVQGYGKLALNLIKAGIDTYSVSGHKIGAPKGIGALYVREGLNLPPLIYGGGQERGLRSGTENTPYIAGFGKAAELSYNNIDNNIEKKAEYLNSLKKSLLTSLDKYGVEYIINGPGQEGAPHIINLRFPGAKSEVLLHYLEGLEIYVSQGSACHNNTKSGSETLTAMGFGVKERDESLRFSFGEELENGDMEKVASALKAGVDLIKGMRKK